MTPLLTFIAAAALGFQVGWERMPEGGMRYVIELNPAAIDALCDHQTLSSAIPADAGEIRAFRIVMGSGRPSREPPPPKPAPPPAKAATPAPPPPTQSSLSFVLTALGLFASLGANVFLAWVARGFRKRCQPAESAS